VTGKKIKEKLDKHALSRTHLDYVTRWNEDKSSKTNGSVVSQLSNAHRAAVAKNWQYAEKLTELLLFLTRQGLALRGHDESQESNNRGNFLELCELFGKYDQNFADRIQKSLNMTSHEIQDDLIKIAAKQVKRAIVDEVKTVGYFCLMADEARSFRDEQLALCIRYAVDLDIHERFLMFVDCSGCQDADGITRMLVEAVQSAELAEVPIIAQAYDGASVMSGKDNGVQKQIRDLHPTAIYIHCMAHKLNLVIVASCLTTRHTVSFFANLHSLYVFFSRPGNNKSFLACREALGISAKKAPMLTSLSDTRWACRWRNVNATRQSLGILVRCLQELSQPESGNRCLAEATGLFHQLNGTSFVVCLVVLDKVLSQVQVVNALLQTKNITLAQAYSTVANTVASLEGLRCDSEWNLVWKEILQLEAVAGITRKVSLMPNGNDNGDRSLRQIKKVSRMDDFVIMSTCGQRENQSDKLQTNIVDDRKQWQVQVFYPVIDSVVGEMRRRFLDHDVAKLAKAVDAAIALDEGGIDDLLLMYGSVLQINGVLLKAEMQIVKSSVHGLKRFNPSNKERFCPPATPNEVAELKKTTQTCSKFYSWQ